MQIRLFQDPILRPSYWYGQREHKTSSFQDPISRPLCTYNEESLVISDHEQPEQTQPRKLSTEAPQEDFTTDFETPFKTIHINGVRVSGEKDNGESHFKTPTDGTQGSREQQRQKLTPFKTPDIKHRTGRVHFKTFDDWIKARKMNCDTVLKDVSSFVSEKEEDRQRSYPSHRQPNSQWTKRNGDPQTFRSSPIDRGEISVGDFHSRSESTMEHRGEFTMEQNRVSPELQMQEMASNSQRGKDSKQNCYSRPLSHKCFIMKEAKKPKSDRNDSFQDPQLRQRRRVTVKDTNRVMANRATD